MLSVWESWRLVVLESDDVTHSLSVQSLEMQSCSDSEDSLRWRHNKRDGVSNHRRLDCLFNRLFKRISNKASKPRVTGLCEGNPPVTGGFPSQRASNVEMFSYDHVIMLTPSSVLYFPFFLLQELIPASLVKPGWWSKVAGRSNHLLGRICLKS